MRPLKISEFAKEREVSRARVYQWLDDGRIRRIVGGEHDGKIDADDAHAKLGELLDQTKGMRRDGNVTSMPPAQVAGAAGVAVPVAATVAAAPGAAASIPGGQLPLAGDQGEEKAAGAGKSEPGAGKNDTDYWTHKAKREEYDALLTQARYLKEAGSLTSAAGVRKEAIESARTLRNAMLAIPDRIASVIDPANPARAHKLLTEEIRKALRELSDRMAERAAAAGAEQPEPALV